MPFGGTRQTDHVDSLAKGQGLCGDGRGILVVDDADEIRSSDDRLAILEGNLELILNFDSHHALRIFKMFNHHSAARKSCRSTTIKIDDLAREDALAFSKVKELIECTTLAALNR